MDEIDRDMAMLGIGSIAEMRREVSWRAKARSSHPFALSVAHAKSKDERRV